MDEKKARTCQDEILNLRRIRKWFKKLKKGKSTSDEVASGSCEDLDYTPIVSVSDEHAIEFYKESDDSVFKVNKLIPIPENAQVFFILL